MGTKAQGGKGADCKRRTRTVLKTVRGWEAQHGAQSATP